MKRRSTLAIVAVGAMLALSACGGGGDSEPAATAEGGVPLVKEGKLTTCTHLSYQPFQFEKDGEVVGFDVDIVDAVAKKLGVEQEIVNVPFEPITAGASFAQDQCDVAAAAMTITPEREEAIDFSEPYFPANQAILTREDKTAKDEDGLKDFKVAAQAGTTGLDYATEHFKDAEVVTYEDLPLSLEALKNGQADAVINDNGVLYDYAANNDGFAVGFDIDTGEHYGIGMKKGNAEMKKAVDDTLAEIKDNGEYDKIYEKWFGDAPK
ncbi:basic amino acid ABC transporter substrate-binding protein [Brevibacterium renqingii]|uniref:basic amino acid ABC transporter substrate-binding protein n=1 Tax=Brevibacterium renqingii TaxID=2776916 RepID=UPI001FE8A582|nr:basic amino acid ABC transporter substrate-binding protein [Brevibacterium renqingii]